MFGEKGICFENVENNENETRETRYFVERDRNRRKMAKTKQAQTNIFLRKKNETITRRVKQGDTQKGKIEKQTNKKRRNKRNERQNEEKRSKRRR